MDPSSSAFASLAPGRTIGGCRILREVKRGGMGCVYLAEHSTLKCHVALKTILPFQNDERARRMFFREARLCARVDHPNVIVIHDAGEERKVPYIVMRYVEGKNLSEYLEDQAGPIPWQTALRVMRLAVRGLAAVHRKGLVHRDVKPSNIMVSNEGRVLLMDFGLVREVADASLAAQTGIVGTPQFMPPEQIEGKPLDARSDIFGVGATLYYLLTAASPFGRGSPEKILTRILARQAPQAVHLLNPSVPREVSDLVSRAMDFDPERRFQSADELHQAIRKILLEHPQPEPARLPTAVPEETPSLSLGALAPELAPLELIPEDTEVDALRRRRGRWLLLGGVASAAILSLLVAILSSAEPRPAAAPTPDLNGMVRIAAGNVRIGTPIERINTFFQLLGEKYAPLGTIDAQLFEQRELTVPVAEFWIDKYEVTNEEYLRFLRETRHGPPSSWPGGHPGAEALSRPVTGVTYADASAYARWAKKRLPTAAQWTRAFRGDSEALFPWGDEFRPELANVGENRRLKALDDVRGTPGDVSGLGVCNLAGNASELTRDIVPFNGQSCVIVKGGNGNDPGRAKSLATFQDFLPVAETQNLIGFRCVYEPPATPR